jgi:(1->4)-alpha-D-glucan 1-alpha-D-glucosylmutase
VGRAQARPQSRVRDWFDIDWSRGRLLFRCSADEPDDELDDRRGGELRYYEHRFPIADGTGEGHPAGGATTASTTSWSTGPAATSRLSTAVLHDHDLGRACVRRGPGRFDATHAEILRWHARAKARRHPVDHPD